MPRILKGLCVSDLFRFAPDLTEELCGFANLVKEQGRDMIIFVYQQVL
jgi:hypothetical protein